MLNASEGIKIQITKQQDETLNIYLYIILDAQINQFRKGTILTTRIAMLVAKIIIYISYNRANSWVIQQYL